MFLLLPACLAAIVLAAPDTPEEELNARIAALRQPLVLDEEGRGISGPGAEFLMEEGARSSFFLIGEMHGNRETPRLTEALLVGLRPHGYGVLALEVGPFSGRMLAELAASQSVEELATFLDGYPRTFPFFDGVEEAEMLLGAVAQGYRIEGLDQEFIASARFHLDTLQDLAPGDAAREVAAEFARNAWELYETALAKGERGETFLGTAAPETFDRLQAAFAGGPPEARELIHELRESAAIYQLWSAGRNYESNHRRIQWMKGHLRRVLDATPDRVLMKFGNVHLSRGLSPLNQLDLGNLAAEVGPLRGGESFHVTVAAHGVRRVDQSFEDFTAEAPSLARFPAPADGTFGVFDLRALRPLVHDEPHASVDLGLHELVFAYDALVMLPEVHPARRLRE